MLNWIIKSTAHVNTCRITVAIVHTESTYASRIGITYSTILLRQTAQIALLTSLLHQKHLHYPKLHLCKHCTRRQHKEHYYNIFHSWILTECAYLVRHCTKEFKFLVRHCNNLLLRVHALRPGWVCMERKKMTNH
jgi:hypothetical protein